VRQFWVTKLIMRALSIRQPYAELILRGVKTIEYRSWPTRIIGQPFYIYAAKKWAGVEVKRSEVRDQKSDSDVPAPWLTSVL
jgi:predicted transcriptional regulator